MHDDKRYAACLFSDKRGIILPQLAAASTSVLGASPRGGSLGSLSPRLASPRPLSPREPALAAASLPQLPAVSVAAGSEAAPAAEDGDPPPLRHEISLAPSRTAADFPSEGTVDSGPPVSRAAAVPSAQAATAAQRSEGASSTAASGPAGTGVLSLSPAAAAVGSVPEDGATFSAFAAAQAQRGGGSAVSLSDTMFASTASTTRSAADTAARVAAQPEPGSAVHAGGAAGMSQSAGSSEGAGTGGEQATAEGRGMPPRESMLSATDLVEHGQRAASAEAQEVEVAIGQTEDAEPSLPAVAVLSTDELAAATSVAEGHPLAAAEASSGSQPAGEPPPPEVVLGRRTGLEGAATDIQPSVIGLEADAKQPGSSSAPAWGPAMAAESPSDAEADDTPPAAELQASSLQGSDAMQTAATHAAVVSATAVRSEPDASRSASSPAASETENTDADPVILATARPAQAGSASGHTAASSPIADSPELNTGSVACATSDMREAPTRAQPVPAAEPAPTGRSEAELHDPGPAQEAGNTTALHASEPPREAAESSGGEQSKAAGAAVSDEGDDMLDAQSQHSEGSTVSI